MKKNLLFAVVFCASFAQAQVGINLDDPKSTLDVVGKPTDLTHFDGIIAPRITGNELAAKTYTTAQTGAMVYVTAASTSLTGQVINVAEPGYYYFDGTVWKTFLDTNSGDTTDDAWINDPTNTMVKLGTKSDGTVRDDNTDFVALDNGNVGIGTSNPARKFEVIATEVDKRHMLLRTVGGTVDLEISGTPGAGNHRATIRTEFDDDSDRSTPPSSVWLIQHGMVPGDESFAIKNFWEGAWKPLNAFVINPETNNIGMGVDAPDSNLHIRRSGRANFKLQSTSNLSVFWQEAWGATGGGSVHRFVSGRGSKTSPSLMQTDDKLGGLEFWGYTQRTGSAEGFAMGATIESYMAANAVAGADNLPSDLRFVTESATDSGERMRIDQNGNVGINVTSPTARLHIADIQTKKSIQIDKPSGVIGGAQIFLNENRSSGTGGIKQKAIQLTNSATLAPQTEIAAQYDVNGLRYFYIDAHQTNVGTNPEEAPDFMITKDGNVGIGATSMLEPAAKLDVRGAIKIGTNAATASVGMMRYDDTTGTFQGYKTCTAAKPCNGGVTTGTGWVDLH